LPLTSRKQPLDVRAMLIQGDSVRMTWGVEEPSTKERKPLRRDPPPQPGSPPPTDDMLRLRLGEELDYARRRLDAMGDQISTDPILIQRHAVALQSLDIVGQIIGHIANVIRSSDPGWTVESIGMGDLKARLTRRSPV
jgi:hypothetical protein